MAHPAPKDGGRADGENQEACGARPQRSYSLSKSKRDCCSRRPTRRCTSSKRCSCSWSPACIVSGVGGEGGGGHELRDPHARLGRRAAAAHVGAQDDVDAAPKRRTTEERTPEYDVAPRRPQKGSTPPVPAVPKVVKKVAKAVPTPPVPAVLKREPKEPEEELTCAPPPPADAPHDAPARRPATSLLTAVRAQTPLVTGAARHATQSHAHIPIHCRYSQQKLREAAAERSRRRRRRAGEGAGAAGRAAAGRAGGVKKSRCPRSLTYSQQKLREVASTPPAIEQRRPRRRRRRRRRRAEGGIRRGG